MPHPPDLLDATEQIANLLDRQGIRTIVIGAAAMAAHRYVRHTEDVDLGVNIAVRDLPKVAEMLQGAAFDVACREPGVRRGHPRPRVRGFRKQMVGCVNSPAAAAPRVRGAGWLISGQFWVTNKPKH